MHLRRAHTALATEPCFASFVPKGSLIEHLGVYSLSVLILYEESIMRNAESATEVFTRLGQLTSLIYML